MAFDFSSLKVLIAEDVLPMRRLLTSILETMGVGQVVGAENGAQAYELTRKLNPDIIITDWFMTPIDGVELSKEIRTNMLSPNRMVPIIMVTGYSHMRRVAEARDAGVTEFLVKPFSANDLAKRISFVINKPRDFIDCASFFGPDRRRKSVASYKGPFRRADDNAPRK